jgi:hypothetical protein
LWPKTQDGVEFNSSKVINDQRCENKLDYGENIRHDKKRRRPNNTKSTFKSFGRSNHLVVGVRLIKVQVEWPNEVEINQKVTTKAL